MTSKLQPFAIFFLFFTVLPVGAVAFNITQILSEAAPNFNTFNTLLSRTHIANEINRRQTITVLALDESATSDLYFPDEVLSQILSVHIILDYYDPAKLKALKNRSTLLTTLFQTTGVAKNNMGFINFTHLTDDRLVFSSGVPGSELGPSLIKSVAAQPYNISVLQIGAAIVPEGIDNVANAPFGSVPVNSTEPDASKEKEESRDSSKEKEESRDASKEKEESRDASKVAAPSPSPSANNDKEKKSSAGKVASGISFLVVAGVAFLSL